MPTEPILSPSQPQTQPGLLSQSAPDPHQTHGLLPALQSLFYIIVIAIFIITFTLQPFRIPSGSMEPTLLIGDFLLVNKHSLGFDESNFILPPTSIRRGEIIIFHYPIDPNMHLIKRVVGVPGDHLRLHEGHVYINGQLLTEPYAIYRPSTPDNFRDNFPRLQSTSPDIDPAWWIKMHQLIDHGELIIPTGNYFVLGDNRNGSEDSRYWGFVPRSAIVGKPMLIYFSLPPDQSDAPPTLQSHPWLEAVLDFARWDRIFHIPH
ncbi:signal peptidase I [Granulicella sp. dw_53]|uniref:signal peptidase I n=1 Tax=Granulicella sp. dw_53 TaxID=2719792 RepID=UPI001BD5DAC0|nr:signal peptidase I [Granulicella sp. dw_53]